MWHRIVVKLSFAHAEGRNYRQLPDRARLREEPSPADIVCFKRYSFFELCVSGSMSFFVFSAQECRVEGYFWFDFARWQRDGRGQVTLHIA